MKQEHRTERRGTSFPHVMIAAAGLATLLLVSTDLSGTAAAQVRSPSPQIPDQLRDRAPIGHRQPRPQDLPSAVRRDESRTRGPTAEERALDKKLEICRHC
jgi:hypothetical protein